MKNYLITMPIAGYVTMEVEADSEQDALQKFREEASVEIDHKESTVEVAELDFYDKIVQGNVCYVSHPRVLIEELS